MQRRRGGGGWRNALEEAAVAGANFSKIYPDMCQNDTDPDLFSKNLLPPPPPLPVRFATHRRPAAAALSREFADEHFELEP